MSLATSCSYVFPLWMRSDRWRYHVHLQCASAREANDTTDGPRRIQGERVRDTAHARPDLTSGAQGRRENILTDGSLWTLCYSYMQVAGAALGHCVVVSDIRTGECG